MGSSVSKYYDNLEDAAWWAQKAKKQQEEQNKSRFARVKIFFSKLFNL